MLALYSNHMEVYRAKTREILNRFLGRRLGFDNCIAALDAALAGLIRRPQTAASMVNRSGSLDSAEIRAVMLANNDVVMTEMGRRRCVR